MRLADRLNRDGVKLEIRADCSPPGVTGTLPEGVMLPNTAGDAVGPDGDQAFFDAHDRRWYRVGPGPA